MTRRIDVDRDVCMGAGQCVTYAPATFDQDDMGVAVVADADGDPAAAVRSAVEFCPTRALSFTEDDSA